METIKDMCIYKFKDGNYCVIFKTQYGVEKIYGKRATVLPKLVARVKSVLCVRGK